MPPDPGGLRVRLFPTDGCCECSYDVRPSGEGLAAAAPKSHGPRSGGARKFRLSLKRQLLRVVAPENATPAINMALGLDALRVLEATRGPFELDWLLSVDEEDADEIVENITNAVQGEALRRDRRASALRIEQVDCSAGVALVLPEVCRVAATTAGALPEGVDILWRVAPSSRRPPESIWERCLDGGATARPYWVSAGCAADARLLARTLPPNAIWAAHLRSIDVPPTADEIKMLRTAGCGGLALPSTWSHVSDSILDSCT